MRISPTVARLLSLLIGIMIFLGIFTGCSSTPGGKETEDKTANESTEKVSDETTDQSGEGGDLGLPISKEKITLTAFWPAPANVLKQITGFEEASIFKELEKRTNIHIKFIHGTPEQFNLMINSGDLPDIIMHDNPTDYAYPGGPDKAIADGAYLRLNDYIDKYAPNYKKLINSNEAFKRDSRTDEGNIWGFSMVETKIQGAYTGMVVRRDWLEELNIPFPETFDEWHDMLVAFKEKKGATAPLLLPQNLFIGDESLIAGYGVGSKFYQVDGKVKYGPIEPGFKEYINMMAQWYKEGLIDKDFATRDSASREQLMYSKQTGAWPEGFWMLAFRKRHAEDSDVFRLYAVTTPVKNKGEVAHMRQTNYHIRGHWTAVSAKSKYPVEAVRWLDYLYSDEGYELTNWGLEGEAHVKVNGVPQFTELITKNPDGLVMAEALFQYAMHHGPMHRIWDREEPGWEEDEKACEAIWNKADSAYMIPMITLNADEGTRNSAIMNDINTYVAENAIKYIMGVEDMSTFDQFVKNIKSMNIDEAIQIQQTALDRYYARK